MSSIEFSKRIVRKYRVKQRRPLFPVLVLLKYPAGFSTVIIRQNKFAYSLNFTYQLINNVKYTSRLDANNGVFLETPQEKKSVVKLLPGSILNGTVNLPAVLKSNLLTLNSLSRNVLIRAFNYTNSIFEKMKEFEGHASNSITGPEKLFSNLFNRYSSVRQTGITAYPIKNPAYRRSPFQLSSVNSFLTHNYFLSWDNAGYEQFVERSDWRTANKRTKNFTWINGQTEEITNSINQHIKMFLPAQRKSEYRDNDSHEQSFFNKRDSLIGSYRLPTVQNTVKLYETGIMKVSTSGKSGLLSSNYGINDDHGLSVFNNLDSLIKISNFRPSAVFNNGKLYAADGRKNSESGRSGSSHNRFGFLKATAGFSIPGEREKTSGYRKVKSNYTVFNLRHMDKTPGLNPKSAYRLNGHEPYQQQQSYPAVFPSLEMAFNQADRRQAVSRNETVNEGTVRELIGRTSVIDTPQVDINSIAEQVYGVIMRKIRLEKERRGK